MSAATQSFATESPAFRSAAPQTLRIRLADIAGSLPEEQLLRSIDEDETIDLPASHILAHIVPTLSLSLLAELKPDLIEPLQEVVRLPAHRIAKAYALLETTDSKPDAPDDSLFRDEIPSPSAHLGKILVPPDEPAAAVERAPTARDARTDEALSWLRAGKRAAILRMHSSSRSPPRSTKSTASRLSRSPPWARWA